MKEKINGKTDEISQNKDMKSCHSGHRERMKKRFISCATDNFEDHEILETLLFYSIPRQNTNEIAHELLNNFHSLRGVLDASYESLSCVPMVGQNSYVLFKLMREVMRRYGSETVSENEVYDTLEKIGSYFTKNYLGITTEVVFVMLLNNSLELIDCKRMFEGSLNSAALDIRKLISYANSKQATNVVIAHNHPNGIAVPSPDDMNTTLMLDSAFDLVGIKLIEHILVAGSKFVPLVKTYRNQGLFGEFPGIR